MSEKDPIRIFVSHAFEEDEDYSRVFEYLESRENFFYQNYGNPENMPTGGGLQSIKDELLTQIKPAEILILPIGIYRKHASLVDYQMDVAKAHKMPIVAISEFGARAAHPPNVADLAVDIVEWNDRLITDAISRAARNEGTNQWEVVEFTLD